MKHFYAMFDTTVKPENPGHGFANAKKVIAFTSKRGRDLFLEKRWYDMTAKSVNAAAAWRNCSRAMCGCRCIYVHTGIVDGRDRTFATDETAIIKHGEYCNY